MRKRLEKITVKKLEKITVKKAQAKVVKCAKNKCWALPPLGHLSVNLKLNTPNLVLVSPKRASDKLNIYPFIPNSIEDFTNTEIFS